MYYQFIETKHREHENEKVNYCNNTHGSRKR